MLCWQSHWAECDGFGQQFGWVWQILNQKQIQIKIWWWDKQSCPGGFRKRVVTLTMQIKFLCWHMLSLYSLPLTSWKHLIKREGTCILSLLPNFFYLQKAFAILFLLWQVILIFVMNCTENRVIHQKQIIGAMSTPWRWNMCSIKNGPNTCLAT